MQVVFKSAVKGDFIKDLSGRSSVGNGDEFHMLGEDVFLQVLDEVIGLFTKQTQIDNDRIQIRFRTDVEDALGLGRLYDLEFLLLQKVSSFREGIYFIVEDEDLAFHNSFSVSYETAIKNYARRGMLCSFLIQTLSLIKKKRCQNPGL